MNKKNFQLIIYIVFGFFILVGFGSLALYGLLQKNKQGSSEDDTGQGREHIEVVIWGTLDANAADPIFTKVRGSPRKGYQSVRYIEKSAETIESEYTQAVAFDEGAPDLLLLESSEILAFDERAALKKIPFGYPPLITVADYQNLFIPTTHMFLRSNGYIALPMVADSLVLYYNEGLRRQNNLRQPPKVWEELTKKEYQDVAREYREGEKAVIPFGAYGNYSNAPYLFAALMLQAQEFGFSAPSTEDLITFYTSFVTLRSPVQTWNETFLSARSMFIGNNLLFYPGFMSEYKGLQRANPNIVMQVAPLPQLASDSIAVVPTKLYALVIPEKSGKIRPAYQVVFDTTAVMQQSATDIFKATSLPVPINNFDRKSRVALARTEEEARETQSFFNNITTTEEVFIDTLFSGRSVPLSQETKASVLNALKNVIIGIRTEKKEAKVIEALFE